MLTLVGVVYNVLIGLRFGINGPLPFVPPLGPWDPLTAMMIFLIGVTELASSLLLPCVAYYRITRAHRRSAGVLLLVGGGILFALSVVILSTVVSGALYFAAGALAFSSHPGEVAPVHVAESILPVNR